MPMAEYKPGLDLGGIDTSQAFHLDAILAKHTSYGTEGPLANIDPWHGIHPTVHPQGMFRRPWAEIRLEIFWSQEREDEGQTRAQAIADEAAKLLGYGVVVWMTVGGKTKENMFFYAQSWNDEH